MLLVGQFAMGLLGLLIPWAAPGLPLIASVAGVGLFLFSLRSVVFAYAPDVAPGEMGASTVGVLFGAQQVVTAFSPLIVGIFADWMGRAWPCCWRRRSRCSAASW